MVVVHLYLSSALQCLPESGSSSCSPRRSVRRNAVYACTASFSPALCGGEASRFVAVSPTSPCAESAAVLMTIPGETSPLEEASYSRKLSPASDNIFIVALNPSKACRDERRAIRRSSCQLHTTSAPHVDDDDANNNVVGLQQGGVHPTRRKVGWLQAQVVINST